MNAGVISHFPKVHVRRPKERCPYHFKEVIIILFAPDVPADSVEVRKFLQFFIVSSLRASGDA